MDGFNANAGGASPDLNHPNANPNFATGAGPTPNANPGQNGTPAPNVNPAPNAKPAQNYVNVQTQSLVESPYERSMANLEQVKARNAELLRLEQRERNKGRLKYVGIALVVIVLLAGVAFLLVSVFRSQRAPATGFGSTETPSAEQEPGKIGAYNCEQSDCRKIGDYTEATMLIYDGSYYLYTPETQEKQLLTLDKTKKLLSVEFFTWNEKDYGVLVPEGDHQALFSITNNHIVTEFSYDGFFTDANDAVYTGMGDYTGKYILARSTSPSQYHLIDLSTGESVVHGKEWAFIHDNFLFGYEADGQIRAYLLGEPTAFAVFSADNALFVRDGVLVQVDTRAGHESNLVFYDETDGGKISASKLSFADEFRSLSAHDKVEYIRKSKKFFAIPSARPTE